MHFHVFAIDLIPAPGLASSGGGLRSLQIIEGLRMLGERVTYSLPLANDAVKLNWDSLSAEERDLAFDAGDYRRHPITILNRLCPDAALFLWPQVFTLPISQKHDIVTVYDANGLQNVEGALFESAITGRRPGLAATTLRYARKLQTADIVLTGSSEQSAYWSGVTSYINDSNNYNLPYIEVPYSQISKPEPRDYELGEPTFYFVGSFLPWNTPGSWLDVVLDMVVEAGRGKVVIIGKANALLPHARELNSRLRCAGRSDVCQVIDEIDFGAFSSLINCNGIAVDMHHRTVEREIAVPIRTVTFLDHGVPVIAPSFSNIGKLVERFDAGWALDPADTAAFRALMSDILSTGSSSSLKAKSENGQRLVEACFSSRKGLMQLRDQVAKSIEAKKAAKVGSAKRKSALAADNASAPAVLVLSDDFENFIALRIKIPFDAMYRAGTISGYVVVSNSAVIAKVGDPRRLERIDVIWAQRGALSYTALLTDHFAGRYVLDLDDNLFITPSYRMPYNRKWIDGLKLLIEGANILTMTTPRLAASVQNAVGMQIEHKVVFAPNMTDQIWARRFDGPPEALFLASSDSLPLTTSRGTFLRAVDKFASDRNIPILYAGTATNKFPELDSRIIETGFLKYDVYREVLRNHAMIAVAPLDGKADFVTQEFINCKSDIKMVEFGAASLPAVYANVPPYSDSPMSPGPLIDCDHFASVTNALDKVFDHPAQFAEMAAEETREHRLADHVAPRTWGQAIEATRLVHSMSLTRILELHERSRHAFMSGKNIVSESDFNAADYLAMNPDIVSEIQRKKINPYEHYVTRGFDEGRLWFPGTGLGDTLSATSIRKFVLEESQAIADLEKRVDDYLKT